MRKLVPSVFLAGWLAIAASAQAQELCPGFSIVINTPEDNLMLALHGAETPEEQLEALDKYVAEFPDSPFMPCVHEYYTIAHTKLNNFDKVIEHGELGLAGEYRDLMLMKNLVTAYVQTGRLGDTAFQAILEAPPQITRETTPARSSETTDEAWAEIAAEAESKAREHRAYMEYAFFQLLQREPNGQKRIQWLDQFVDAYPESPNATQIQLNYFLAYQMAGNAEKAGEHGEKAIEADPNNLVALNLVADDYATRQTNVDKAEKYANRALELATNLKKPEGMADEQFAAYQNQQMGMARLTLGYIAFQRGSQTRRVQPAIEHFKAAADLLEGAPQLLGRTLFYLGYAYEVIYPPNHKGAMDALARAAEIASPWQGEARELLAKVRKAAGR
jgi:tetratricopeptide (TPR) repeat protein